MELFNEALKCARRIKGWIEEPTNDADIQFLFKWFVTDRLGDLRQSAEGIDHLRTVCWIFRHNFNVHMAVESEIQDALNSLDSFEQALGI